MPAHELLDVPYEAETCGSSDPQRRLDIFFPADLSSAPALLVFVHGGAWRSGDKSEYSVLARKLATTHHVAVAVINYRLTERDPPRDATDLWQHPGHVRDALDAIEFLAAWPAHAPALPGPGYDATKLYFVGHSCGAHMLATLFLQAPALSKLPPTPHSILTATRGVLLSEGIFSLPLLLDSYPSYASFVEPVFGWRQTGESTDKYDIFSANHYDLREGAEHIVWWVVHSPGDELLDLDQPKVMYESLVTLTDGLGEGLVRRDWNTLQGAHFPCLDEPRFSEIIGEFLA